MARRAQWGNERPEITPSDFSAALGANLEATISEVLAPYGDEAVQTMMHRCQNAIGWYRTNATAQPPAERNRAQAAADIAADARKLADRLTRAGGARQEIAEHLGHGWASIGGDVIDQLQTELNDLFAAATLAEQEIEQERVAGNKRTPTRVTLAAMLADGYLQATGQRPQAKTERETGHDHPYILVLRAAIEHATGRTCPLTTVEHVARDGIRAHRERQ